MVCHSQYDFKDRWCALSVPMHRYSRENHSIHHSLCATNLTLLLLLVSGTSDNIEVYSHQRRCGGQVNSKWRYVQCSKVLSVGPFCVK